MRPNTRYSIIKPSSKAQMLTRKRVTVGLMLLSLLSIGTLLIATQLQAAEEGLSKESLSKESMAKVNLYAKNYREQNSNHLKSQSANPDTKMYVSNHKEDDNINMLENGYDMMGTSGFDAAGAPTEMALQHGKDIQADIVLVYSKYSSAKVPISKLQFIKEAAKKGGEIEPEDIADEPTKYQYYASYWAKLPMPLLGVHVIKLVRVASEDAADIVKAGEEKGLKIIAVIKESPAAKANIVKGDTLLKIGGVDLVKADDLFAAVQRYAGQAVEVELQRGDAEVKTSVALNTRK